MDTISCGVCEMKVKAIRVYLWMPNAKAAVNQPPQTADKVFCLILFAGFVCIFADAKGFAPAGATKGLSDRPLETFGSIRHEILASLGA